MDTNGLISTKLLNKKIGSKLNYYDPDTIYDMNQTCIYRGYNFVSLVNNNLGCNPITSIKWRSLCKSEK